MEEPGVRLVGVQIGRGKDLVAYLGGVQAGEEVEAEIGAVAELADGCHGGVVAEDAGVERDGVAIGMDEHAGEAGGAEVLMQERAFAVLQRAGEGVTRVVVGKAEDGGLDLTDLLPHEAVVELVGDGVVDLDGGHLGAWGKFGT